MNAICFELVSMIYQTVAKESDWSFSAGKPVQKFFSGRYGVWEDFVPDSVARALIDGDVETATFGVDNGSNDFVARRVYAGYVGCDDIERVNSNNP